MCEEYACKSAQGIYKQSSCWVQWQGLMGVINRLQQNLYSRDGWKCENIFAFLVSPSCSCLVVVCACGKWHLKPSYHLKTNHEPNHSGPINSLWKTRGKKSGDFVLFIRYCISGFILRFLCSFGNAIKQPDFLFICLWDICPSMVSSMSFRTLLRSGVRLSRVTQGSRQ